MNKIHYNKKASSTLYKKAYKFFIFGYKEFFVNFRYFVIIGCISAVAYAVGGILINKVEMKDIIKKATSSHDTVGVLLFVFP